jgi:hypothetical protein
MSLEQWVEFLDDCAVVQTHVPRNELDEPDGVFKDALDPLLLLSLIPRSHSSFATATAASNAAPQGSFGGSSQYLHAMGTHADSNDFESNLHNHQKKMQKDVFSITFTQFYQLLIHVAEVVYPELCTDDDTNKSAEELRRGRTIALNKFLMECVVPLYCWCIPTIAPPPPDASHSRPQEAIYLHNKKGCVDPLLLDARIALLLVAFAPNLWKTFLLYAQDTNQKVPELQLAYPQCAQDLERSIFGVPHGCPYHSAGEHRVARIAGQSGADAACLIITEQSLAR